MPRRGEVWWVRLDPTLGSEIRKTRPCLILSTNIINDRRRTGVIVPLSTSPHSAPPLLVPVNCAGRDVVAVTDQIRAVAKERLQECIADISPADLAAVATGVRRILELGRSPLGFFVITRHIAKRRAVLVVHPARKPWLRPSGNTGAVETETFVPLL